MGRKARHRIADPRVKDVGDQIALWRRTRERRTPMPAELWARAVALARASGTYPIARAENGNGRESRILVEDRFRSPCVAADEVSLHVLASLVGTNERPDLRQGEVVTDPLQREALPSWIERHRRIDGHLQVRIPAIVITQIGPS
jgi:hypothetical protein